ncbi:uncharacterized protein LOC117173570 [Belonocnema kinseyi]|uniref:uncharacterized protein LOC117173570 n=1 Tax=Belonocnema kinseyi TaxID=2817044 RepID=UPI00143D90CD|nr:uncharacterized protein LOC117173570 [Belonocnema kinseyi]
MATNETMSFKTLLNIQRDTFGLIDRTISNFNKIGKDNVTAAKVQSRTDILKERWDLASKYHNQINAVATNAERKKEEYFMEGEYSNASDNYEEAMDFLSEWKAKFAPVFQAGPIVPSESSPGSTVFYKLQYYRDGWMRTMDASSSRCN